MWLDIYFKVIVFRLMFMKDSLFKQLVKDSLESLKSYRYELESAEGVTNKNKTLASLGFGVSNHTQTRASEEVLLKGIRNFCFVITKDVLDAMLSKSPEYVVGISSKFIMDVPDKNLKEIKRFKENVKTNISQKVVQYKEGNHWITTNIDSTRFINAVIGDSKKRWVQEEGGWMLSDKELDSTYQIVLPTYMTKYRVVNQLMVLSKYTSFVMDNNNGNSNRIQKIANIMGDDSQYTENIVLSPLGKGFQVVTKW